MKPVTQPKQTCLASVYTLKIAAKAQRELAGELAYSRKQWGDIHAKLYARELRARINTLRTNPYALQERPDIGTSLRLLSYKGNRVVYTIFEETKTVAVLAVLGINSLSAGEVDKRIRSLE